MAVLGHRWLAVLCTNVNSLSRAAGVAGLGGSRSRPLPGHRFFKNQTCLLRPSHFSLRSLCNKCLLLGGSTTTFCTVLCRPSSRALMTSGHYSTFTNECGDSGTVFSLFKRVTLELENSLASALWASKPPSLVFTIQADSGVLQVQFQTTAVVVVVAGVGGSSSFKAQNIREVRESKAR